MPKGFCPSCGFDLTSVMVKDGGSAPLRRGACASITEERQKKLQPEEEVDRMLPEQKEETVRIVKVREPSKRQAEHLAKARESAREVRAEKKRKEKEEDETTGGYKQMFLF